MGALLRILRCLLGVPSPTVTFSLDGAPMAGTRPDRTWLDRWETRVAQRAVNERGAPWRPHNDPSVRTRIL
jgi:hypothetical protein